MARVTFIGERGSQHPIYGVCRENIAPQLTRGNWKTNALWRWNGEMTLYIFIECGLEEDESGKERTLYCVAAYDDATRKLEQAEYRPRFARLQDALDYANGNGDSPFATADQPADPHLLPDRDAPLGTAFPRR